jgi:hypothetical protein
MSQRRPGTHQWVNRDPRWRVLVLRVLDLAPKGLDKSAQGIALMITHFFTKQLTGRPGGKSIRIRG